MMWWNDGSGWGWGGWVGMGLGMLVFWGAVIWLFIRYTSRSSKDQPGPRHADEVLAARFARGEIDDAEYRDRLRVLHGRPGGQPPAAG